MALMSHPFLPFVKMIGSSKSGGWPFYDQKSNYSLGVDSNEFKFIPYSFKKIVKTKFHVD